MLLGINLNFLGVYVGGPLLLYSGSSKVLPGPPKYLPHQCPHRARLAPEIVPVSPLHSAQIISDFDIFNRNVFGHYEGWIGHYFGLYSGSSKVLPGPPKYLHQCPHRVRLVPEIVPDPPLRPHFQYFLAEMYLGTMEGWTRHISAANSGCARALARFYQAPHFLKDFQNFHVNVPLRRVQLTL